MPRTIVVPFADPEGSGSIAREQEGCSLEMLRKKPWVRPALTVVELKDASGATAGPLCDKYGSLSHGKSC